VSGAFVVTGSRVPISALFENLEDGVTAEEFTELFPGFWLQQIKAIQSYVAKHSHTAA